MNTGQFDEKSIGAMRATSVNSWWCLSIPRIIRASCFLLFCRSAMCSVKALELIPSFDKQWILWWVMQRSGAYSLNTMVGRSRLYSAMRSWRKYELAFADAALEIAHINHGIWNICIVFICADSNELMVFGRQMIRWIFHYSWLFYRTVKKFACSHLSKFYWISVLGMYHA